MVTLRARPWLLLDAGAAMMVTFEVPAGVVEGLPMPPPCHSCRHGSRGYKQQTELQMPPLRRAFPLAPYPPSPAIPPGSQKTIAGRCHAVLKSRNMFSRGGASQCNTLHRLSPSGAVEVSLDDFALL